MALIFLWIRNNSHVVMDGKPQAKRADRVTQDRWPLPPAMPIDESLAIGGGAEAEFDRLRHDLTDCKGKRDLLAEPHRDEGCVLAYLSGLAAGSGGGWMKRDGCWGRGR
jgi:hypothetical protein